MAEVKRHYPHFTDRKSRPQHAIPPLHPHRLAAADVGVSPPEALFPLCPPVSQLRLWVPGPHCPNSCFCEPGTLPQRYGRCPQR